MRQPRDPRVHGSIPHGITCRTCGFALLTFLLTSIPTKYFPSWCLLPHFSRMQSSSLLGLAAPSSLVMWTLVVAASLFSSKPHSTSALKLKPGGAPCLLFLACPTSDPPSWPNTLLAAPTFALHAALPLPAFCMVAPAPCGSGGLPCRPIRLFSRVDNGVANTPCTVCEHTSPRARWAGCRTLEIPRQMWCDSSLC